MTFDRIYRDNLWNGVESHSGPGSGTTATRNIAKQLTDLVKLLKVESVLNVGCGDDFWMPDLPGYLGVDVSSEAIDLARKNHPDRFYRLLPPDSPSSVPEFDLVICRDVLQHLSQHSATWLVDRMNKIGRLLLLSTYMSVAQGHDIEDGGYTEPNLMLEPFSLGAPMLLFFDGYQYAEEDPPIRDPRKFLGLWRGRG